MSTSLFVIKTLHSVAIVYFMGCLLIIWQYALTGLYGQWLPWIFTSLILESIVFISFGFECPFTIWAIELGDDTGADLISDMFYLENVDFVKNYVLFAVIGMFLAARRYVNVHETP